MNVYVSGSDITVTPPGTGPNSYVLVSVTEDVTGCTPAALIDNATVTVNTLPTADITGTNTICEGDNTDITFNLAGSVIGTYNVAYSDGTSTFNLNGIPDGHMITVSPTVSTNPPLLVMVTAIELL